MHLLVSFISKNHEIAETCGKHTEEEKQGKQLSGRPRRRYVGTIRMHRKGIGSVDMDWIHQTQKTRPF